MTTRELRKMLTPVVVGLILIGIVYVAVAHPPFGTLTCKMSSAPGDPHAEYVYKATFSFWKVKQMNITETITSKNQAILELFQELEKKENEQYKSLSYYESNSSLKEKELVLTTSIRYGKESKKESNQGPIKVGKLKKIYQKNGAICSYR